MTQLNFPVIPTILGNTLISRLIDNPANKVNNNKKSALKCYIRGDVFPSIPKNKFNICGKVLEIILWI